MPLTPVSKSASCAGLQGISIELLDRESEVFVIREMCQRGYA